MDKPRTPRRAKRRARKPDGTFKGDTQPEVNQAWEPAEVPVREPLKYSITTKVTGMGSDTAGKYAKKPSIRPRFNHGTTGNI